MTSADDLELKNVEWKDKGKKIAEEFWPTHYVSIKTGLNVSKTGHFLDPPTQSFCWRNIRMVPSIINLLGMAVVNVLFSLTMQKNVFKSFCGFSDIFLRWFYKSHANWVFKIVISYIKFEWNLSVFSYLRKAGQF